MKRLWVVDDKIPFAQVASGLPVPTSLDAATIRFLATDTDSWEDENVLQLCQAIASSDKYESTFFVSPMSLMRYLDEGVTPPDAIVFDWEYSGVEQNDVVALAERVLAETAAFVQIYTHTAPEAVEPAVASLKSKSSGRLLSPKFKQDVSADALADNVRAAWEGTLAGKVASSFRAKLRRSAETALRDLSTIPTVAMSGLAEGKAEHLVAVLLARVREELALRNDDVFEAASNVRSPGETALAEVQKLISFWYYVVPSDVRVRRGDIVRITKGELPTEYGLVVTSPCDLASFGKKTGGTITWLRLRTVEDVSHRLFKQGEVSPDKVKVGRSILANIEAVGDRLVLLPNVPTSSSRDVLLDLVVASHEWRSSDVEFRKARDHLEYGAVSGFQRLCTLAEPFLASVLSRAVATLVAPGLPDLPAEEQVRLTSGLRAKFPSTGSKPPSSARKAEPRATKIPPPDGGH